MVAPTLPCVAGERVNGGSPMSKLKKTPQHNEFPLAVP